MQTKYGLLRHMYSLGFQDVIVTTGIKTYDMKYYNMTVWILARNDINFSMAAGLIRLYMPGVK